MIRLIIATTLLLMATAHAAAQTIYAGQTTQLEVVQVAGDTYTWELYNDVAGINFATTSGNCPVSMADFAGGNTGAAVSVHWIEPGTYFFKVTAWRDYGTSFCSTNNIKVGIITVLPSIPTAKFADPSPICRGDTAYLSMVLTGVGPWTVTYLEGSTSITITGITTSTYLIPVSPKTTTAYTIISVADTIGVNIVPEPAVTLIVNPKPNMTRITQF